MPPSDTALIIGAGALLVIADIRATSYISGRSGSTQDKPSGCGSPENDSAGNMSSEKKSSKDKTSGNKFLKDKSSDEENSECPECKAIREVRELREARERRERGRPLADLCRPCMNEYLEEHPIW